MGGVLAASVAPISWTKALVACLGREEVPRDAFLGIQVGSSLNCQVETKVAAIKLIQFYDDNDIICVLMIITHNHDYSDRDSSPLILRRW